MEFNKPKPLKLTGNLTENFEDYNRKNNNKKRDDFRTSQNTSKGWTKQWNQVSSTDNKGNGKSSFSKSNLNIRNVDNYINDCNRYDKSHKVRECPAYKKICSNCGLLNHFKVKCKLIKNKQEGQVDNLETYNLVSIDALEIMFTEQLS